MWRAEHCGVLAAAAVQEIDDASGVIHEPLAELALMKGAGSERPSA
jgi:hypothetical protein